MSTITPWGYTLTDDKRLKDLLNENEFNAFTAGKFYGDPRIAATIPSISASIRNYCGWHISPNLECIMVYNIRDLRDTFTGPDVLIQLPATYVTEIDEIILGATWNADAQKWEGDTVADYDLKTSGLLRVFDAGCYDRKARVYIKYKAGLPDDQIGILKELTANRIAHAVTSSYGVASETAGGVSVSYSATWSNSTRAASLPDDSRDILEAYRVKGVF